MQDSPDFFRLRDRYGGTRIRKPWLPWVTNAICPVAFTIRDERNALYFSVWDDSQFYLHTELMFSPTDFLSKLTDRALCGISD